MGKLLSSFLAIGLVTFALAPEQAHAQAWVSDRGTLGLDLDYNFFSSSRVVTDTTFEFPDAGTRGHQVMVGAEYTPVDKLAISASLPMVALKYTGAVMNGQPTLYSHAPHGSYDDGSTHTTLTDLKAGARYQVLDDSIALTPSLAFTIPVADYETIGNTVAGRHLKMAHLGLSLGYLFGTATYGHLSYELTLAQKYDPETTDASVRSQVKSIGQNRSDASVAIGTKVLDYRLDLHLASEFRINHDGLNFSDIDPTLGPNPSATAGQIEFHDAILKEQVLLVGAGLGYSLTNTVTVTADFRYFVEPLSRNTLDASVLAIGLSWAPQLTKTSEETELDIDANAEGGATARR
jgi:hypothetical protein